MEWYMKKFFLLFCGLLMLTSCTNKYENLLKSNTAEVREFVFAGEKDDAHISLVCGYREKDYILNGYATELIEFGVITCVMPESFSLGENTLYFTLFVGTEKYTGDLQVNPFDGSLVADIKKIIDSTSNVSIRITCGEYLLECKLNLVNKSFSVNSDEIYKLVADKFAKEISGLIVNNEFVAEVYVKIIDDADNKVSDYMWYVSIITRTGGHLNILISPYTSEILAINNTL